MGSLAALPFAWVIQAHYGNRGLLLASLVAFLVGWAATRVYLRYTQSEDPKEIVIDEVHGQWLILAFMQPTLLSYGIGFTLFRLFDITKIWPICVSDRRIKGGFGVMFDDTLAALYPLLIAVLAVCALRWLNLMDTASDLRHFLGLGNVF